MAARGSGSEFSSVMRLTGPVIGSSVSISTARSRRIAVVPLLAAAVIDLAGGLKGAFPGGVWLRSSTLSRLRQFQTICPVVPWRSARTQAGSSLAWTAALNLGVVLACYAA